MATFVLVHGAWHGGACWDRVVPLLEQAGHQVHAPDLPGMGDDATPLSTISLQVWAQWLAAYLERLDAPAVLVGHSRGGIVISAASELAPERVAGLVYLAAFMLGDGESMVSSYQIDDPEAAQRALRFSDDGSAVLLPEAAREWLYQLTPDDVADQAVSRLCAEPMWVHGQALSLSAERHGRLPRAYIETLRDAVFPLALQRQMQTRWLCDAVVALDTDHSPFYSAPQALAQALMAVDATRPAQTGAG